MKWLPLILILLSPSYVLAKKAVPKVPSYPPVRIVNRERIPTQDCKPDPLNPCVNEVLTIQNDLFISIEVFINCGTNYEDAQSIVIFPRTKLMISIELTSPPVTDQGCKISHYTKWEYPTPTSL